jgi:hypothetical protein
MRLTGAKGRATQYTLKTVESGGKTSYLRRGPAVRTSPKQPQPRRHRDWYPYHAGYTQRFVDEVLAAFATDATSVLDPWNGSGTTTAACFTKGLVTYGIDINPALTVIARARLTPQSVSESLTPIGMEIVRASRRSSRPPEPGDPLAAWLHATSISALRAIQSAIHKVLSEIDDRLGPAALGQQVMSAPLLVAFYYAALFITTRDLLEPFRTTNPTWHIHPRNSRGRLRPSETRIVSTFLGRIRYLAERLSVPGDRSHTGRAVFYTTSATSLPFPSGELDAVVTSPPYATRIDYVMNTLPELAILGATPAEIEDLRRCSTGSPVVAGIWDDLALTSTTGRVVLDVIRRHSSKGSASYYYPWMTNYLRGLQRGLSEVSRVVREKGPICVVVQDSYYKEVHIDLQRIVVETLESRGRRLTDRLDYGTKHHMARMNPYARRHLSVRNNVESLLVFQ